MKHLLVAALLALGLAMAAQTPAQAAAFGLPGASSDWTPGTSQSAVTRANGWWAVPVVAGGVIILHHHLHRYPRRCYSRCRRHRGPRYCRRACW